MVAILGALLLVGLLPGAVSADRVLKYEDHSIDSYCETTVEDDFVSAYASTSEQFDDFAGFDLWRAPAIPYEEPASITGVGDAVDASGVDPIVMTASIPVSDADGNALGDGTLTMTLTATGDSETFTEPGFGNHKSRTEGTRRFFEGTGSFVLGTMTVAFPTCFGTVTDVSVFNTNPHSFVSRTTGFQLSCSWESEADAYVAVLDVFTDAGGPNAGAFLATPGRELFTNAWTGTIEVTGIDISIELIDEAGAIEQVDASATLTPVGTPVTSRLRDPNSHTKVTEQVLAPDGVAVFSTGQTLPIDQEHCRASEFDQHTINTQPKGPKPTAKVPVNDAPAGAITLKPGGKRLVTDNRGARSTPRSRSRPVPRASSTTSGARSGTRSPGQETRSRSTRPEASWTRSSGSTSRRARTSSRSAASTMSSSIRSARRTRRP